MLSKDHSWIQQLKPGDKVIVRHPYNPSQIKTVKSVGKRLITLKDDCHRFSVIDGWQAGRNIYVSSHIEKATPEKIAQIEDLEQLTKIAEIIGVNQCEIQ